ncbi:short-chain dehydrogenase, partial [Rhodococcus sp. NPDC076796]
MMNNAPHTPARTVAITGGARGIGYQTAKELIRR